MDSSEQNRLSRRDAKRHRRRCGQRGGTGKRMFLIQEQIDRRARQVEQSQRQHQQQLTKSRELYFLP